VNDSGYISKDTLARFVAAENHKVDRIVCHLWQNLYDPGAPVEVIVNLELVFGDTSHLVISANEEENTLEAIDFDLKRAQEELRSEFGEKIRLHAVDASATSMWKDVSGKILKSVRLSREGDRFMGDSLVLDFGGEQRIISMSPLDGLVIDFFEV